MYNYLPHHHFSFLHFNPEWITAIVAVIASIITIYEFYFRRRPYIKLEIEPIKTQADSEITFFARVVNFGTVPAVFNLKKEEVQIKIGDEEYSSEADCHGYTFPNEAQPPKISLGSINQIGINKILEKNYKDNNVYLEVTLYYHSYRLRFGKYKFYSKYKIDFLKSKEHEVEFKVSIIDQIFT